MLDDIFEAARGYYPELKDHMIGLDTLDMTLTRRKVVFAKVRAIKTINGDHRWVIFLNRKVLEHEPPREFLLETICHELEHIRNGDVDLEKAHGSSRPHAGGRIDREVKARIDTVYDISEGWKKHFVEGVMKKKRVKGK
ncbi:hypothetical protein CUJ83_12200 [Methanocella sp. CWC-04]|uniref:SprT-like family protein n=1 Tax=Methanooceanicella nereidis TaxID=2052831 RepID=A0AAP2RF99_9EURY|nr:hypothetical protein [Methanocella sp. CWC-04]MCD1295761.1 hypothetical protein [Methanocella sp. CWC-04]